MVDTNSQKFLNDDFVITRERFLANLSKFMSTSITFFRRESENMELNIKQLENMISVIQKKEAEAQNQPISFDLQNLSQN